jgi:hypothetical protein
MTNGVLPSQGWVHVARSFAHTDVLGNFRSLCQWTVCESGWKTRWWAAWPTQLATMLSGCLRLPGPEA